VLPKGTKAVEVNPEIDFPRAGKVPDAGGQVMTAGQVRTVIRAAYSRLGWPYVWGGESEAEGGYDCSGLMQYAFAQAGIRLPRVAADQARAGWVIPYSKAQPGDMLIWANDPTAPGYISHIALYLGDGKMIHAPRRGTVVRIQNVYTRNMRRAVRVSPKLVNSLHSEAALTPLGPREAGAVGAGAVRVSVVIVMTCRRAKRRGGCAAGSPDGSPKPGSRARPTWCWTA